MWLNHRHSIQLLGSNGITRSVVNGKQNIYKIFGYQPEKLLFRIKMTLGEGDFPTRINAAYE